MTTSPWLEEALARRLASLRDAGLERRLVSRRPDGPGRIVSGGRHCVNFASNDYLGLSRHPAVVERAAEFARTYGAGAGASRLVSGSLDIHADVEAKIARWKGTEAALLFASGYQANAAVLRTLFDAALYDAPPQVFSDKLIHASLHAGCAAAGVRQIRYAHNDLDHLRQRLEAAPPGPKFILTESVFSMDGDCADLPALKALADEFGAAVYADDAHASGVIGPGGKGLAGPETAHVVMGTFSKALGAFGAYVAGPQMLIDYLIAACGGVIYTTALSPPMIGAIDAALDLVPGMDPERAHLAALSDRLRTGLRACGLDTGASVTQIVPAITGAAGDALRLSAALNEAGYLAVAIRPPTVPQGGSRIRFAVSAAHTDADVDGLLCALEAARVPA